MSWSKHFALRNLLVAVLLSLASFSVVFADETPSDTATATQIENESQKQGTVRWLLGLPFEYVIQPLFSVIIYPFSEPLRYAFENGVIDKGVEMITFGEDKNIFVYPTMNLKPGTTTMLGFSYRHSHFVSMRDYFVLTGGIYANSDLDYAVRYSVKRLFDGKTYIGVAHRGSLDRNSDFTLLGTNEHFVQADSVFKTEFRVAHPLPVENLGVEFTTEYCIRKAGLPDLNEDLVDVAYQDDLVERGVYQDYNFIPLHATLSYNGTESPYVPTSGSNAFLKFGYVFVGDYKDTPEYYEWLTTEKNHDYMDLEFVFQRYFYFGSVAKVYQFSRQESRQRRREYQNFSIDGTLKMWDPTGISSWILERRVLAMQFRYRRAWEIEKDGMPIKNYPNLGERFPLRGYGDFWVAPAVMGISWEYRWPIDYYVDGVAFLEYGAFSDEYGEWDFDKNLRNSWGFGVRVRKPDMYFFRFQLGFHGLHGIHLVLTIKPEFQ